MNNLINRLEEIYNNIRALDISATDAEKKEYLKNNSESITNSIAEIQDNIKYLNQTALADQNLIHILKNISVRIYNIALNAEASQSLFNASFPEDKETLDKIEKLINDGMSLADEGKKITGLPDTDIDQAQIDRIKVAKENKIADMINAANQTIDGLLKQTPVATPAVIRNAINPITEDISSVISDIKNRNQTGNLSLEVNSFIIQMQTVIERMNFDRIHQQANNGQSLYDFFKNTYSDKTKRDEYVTFMKKNCELLNSIGGTTTFDVAKYEDFNNRINIESYTSDVTDLVDPSKELNEVIDAVKNKYQSLNDSLADINNIVDNVPSNPTPETIAALTSLYESIYDNVMALPIKADNLENMSNLDEISAKLDKVRSLLDKMINKGVTSSKVFQDLIDRIDNTYKANINKQLSNNNIKVLDQTASSIDNTITTIVNEPMNLAAFLSDAHTALANSLTTDFGKVSESIGKIDTNEVDSYINSANQTSELTVSKLYDNLLKLMAMSSPQVIDYKKVYPNVQPRIIEYMSNCNDALTKIASKFDGKNVQTAGNNVIGTSELESKYQEMFGGQTFAETIDAYRSVVRSNQYEEQIEELKEIKKTKVDKKDQAAITELLNKNFDNSEKIINLIGALPNDIELSEKEIKQLSKMFDYKFSIFKKLTDDGDILERVADKDDYISKMEKDLEVLKKIQDLEKVKEKHPNIEDAYNQAKRRVNILRVSNANNIPYAPVGIKNNKPKKNRKDLLVKGLKKTGVFILGVGTGIILSCVPGVGTIRMAIAVTKIAVSAINAWTNKHPNGKIATKINDVKQKYPKISGVAGEIKQAFKAHPNINVFINGVAVGYLAGNIWEMATGHTVLESIGESMNQSSSVATTVEVQAVEQTTPNVEAPTDAVDATPTDVPDTTVSVDNAVTDPITETIDPVVAPEVTQYIPSFGEPIDASGIQYGYRAAEHAMNGEPVKMFTDLGHNVHIGNKVTLPNGQEMWALFQDDGVGYGWFKAEDVINAVNDKAADLASSGLSR